ncbi:hypothetical protein D9758_001150 [Tetrapyrgos nigripes]|uniref:Uncharacterized protein n=1 Tax=Tetrapyrgos nigripes TaxID=182062 RepID=A0A8H5GRR7_9AGAR|nr:hypothetical protein D9758_001150 [Tetrapyrgos nigripes]
MELTKHSQTIAQLIADHPDDPVCELAVAVLSHSINAVHFKVNLFEIQTPQAKLMKTLDMSYIVSVVISAMKKPHATKYLIAHGETLISYSAFFHSKVILCNSSALNFLVARLRAKDWENRCLCLAGLLRLYRLNSEEDTGLFDPNAFMQAVMRPKPAHINDTLMMYGQNSLVYRIW